MNETFWANESRRNDGLTYRGHYHRRVAEQEEEFVVSQLLPHRGRILEVGPGSGRFTRHLVVITDELVACDVNSQILSVLHQRCSEPSKLVCVHRPFERFHKDVGDCSFDAVVAMRVVPYLDDWKGTVSRLAGLVKPGGVLIFDLWNNRSFEGWWQKLRSRRAEVVPEFVDVSLMLRAIEELPLTIRAAYRWGYPRLGSISLDAVGSLLFPQYAFSTTFCCQKITG